MKHAAREFESPLIPGLIAVTLGSIGMLLCFLPILGAPISAVGLLLSLAATVVALVGGRTSLRWSVAGLSVCVAAFVLNCGIAFAPQLLVPSSAVQPSWQTVPDHPYTSPPARPN